MKEQQERIIRLPEVKSRIGLGRSRIYQMMEEGIFPSPIKLSERAIGWLESEIASWIDDRVKEREEHRA